MAGEPTPRAQSLKALGTYTTPPLPLGQAQTIRADPHAPPREGLAGWLNWLASFAVPVYPEQEVGPVDLLAAVPPLRALKAFATGTKAADAVGDTTKGIRAYHGSPHDFDTFALEKIGTGEGAQAYGHGLYFAEREGVAKQYKKALTDWEVHEPTGRVVTSAGSAKTFRGTAADRALAWVQDAASRNDISDPLRFARGNAAKVLRGDPAEKEILGQLDEWIQAGAQVKPGGHMYEVNINADPAHFLDWDAPFSGQSPHVQEALRNLGVTPKRLAKLRYRHSREPSGGDLYRALHENPEEATRALREAGVPGIQYLDAGSRIAGAGSRNYSIADDALIDILRKYGWLPPVGLATLGHYGQHPAQEPTR